MTMPRKVLESLECRFLLGSAAVRGQNLMASVPWLADGSLSIQGKCEVAEGLGDREGRVCL